MSIPAYPGQSILEALDTNKVCALVSSDGAAGTLSGNILTRHISEATGLDVQAQAGGGIHSVFNSKVAMTDSPVAPAAAPQPVIEPAPAGQGWAPTNG